MSVYQKNHQYCTMYCILYTYFRPTLYNSSIFENSCLAGPICVAVYENLVDVPACQFKPTINY